MVPHPDGGTTYGDVPLNLEQFEVWDSPNSAGVITDAIRCAKLGLDRGLAGTLVAPSSYFMKSPPLQIHDDVAHERVEAFIRGEDTETLVGTETSPSKTRGRPRQRRSRAARLPGGSRADGDRLAAAALRSPGRARPRAAHLLGYRAAEDAEHAAARGRRARRRGGQQRRLRPVRRKGA